MMAERGLLLAWRLSEASFSRRKGKYIVDRNLPGVAVQCGGRATSTRFSAEREGEQRQIASFKYAIQDQTLIRFAPRTVNLLSILHAPHWQTGEVDEKGKAG